MNNEENWCDATGEKNAAIIREATKLVVWRVRPVGCGPWLYGGSIAELAGVVEDGAEGGTAYELEAVEMTREAWSKVSDDFPGW